MQRGSVGLPATFPDDYEGIEGISVTLNDFLGYSGQKINGSMYLKKPSETLD